MKIHINLIFDYNEKATAEVKKASIENNLPIEEYVKGFIEEGLLFDYSTIDGETISYDYKIEE